MGGNRSQAKGREMIPQWDLDKRLLDPEFDRYSDCEINDMVNAAKSGVVSTANENLYSLPRGKYYDNTWAKNKRLKEKLEKERERWLVENRKDPVMLNARQLFMSLLGLKTEKGHKILSDFAESSINQKLFKKYSK